MKRLIIFLIRKRLGLKRYECFQFTNQKDMSTVYFFEPDRIRKFYLKLGSHGTVVESDVSLNWLLDSRCKIAKLHKTFEEVRNEVIADGNQSA